MLRFYNGVTPESLDEMSVIEFDQYWQSITKIEAQEMLLEFTIADYPHLKPNRRREVYRKLKRLQTNGREDGALMSPEEIAKAIGAISG
tara:strand:- start:817 stop:1083 length:267 start_codon:yes stop_codon:yes gene_type:complete